MFNNIKISEIMTTDLITVNRSTTMDKVKYIFQENSIHHVPVVNEDGVLEGMISEEELILLSHHLTIFNLKREERFNAKYLKTVYAHEVMKTKLVSLKPSHTVGMAADIFRENLFHALPILEDDRLVGILTTYDLINYAYRAPYLINS